MEVSSTIFIYILWKNIFITPTMFIFVQKNTFLLVNMLATLTADNSSIIRNYAERISDNFDLEIKFKYFGNSRSPPIE